MAFCNFSEQFNEKSYTLVSNIFISQFMPDAPPRFTDVYLFGLYLSSQPSSQNSLENMKQALSLSADEIVSAYDYWEQLGLVNVLEKDSGCEISYLPAEGGELFKKINPSKYAKFNKDMQRVISGRMLSMGELNEYYTFLESSHFDPNALIAVAHYAKELKGDDVSHRYILAIARNFSSSGLKSLESVSEKIERQPKYNEDLLMLFKALKIKSKADFEDRSIFETWTRSYGYSLDTLLAVAKKVKSGGMKRMSSLMEEYRKQNLFSAEEIKAYEDTKQQRFDLAIQINRNLGLYFENLTPVIEKYVTPWLNKGYDGQTLVEIASYCFKTALTAYDRSLESMDGYIQKLFSLGITDMAAFHQYMEHVKQKQNVLQKLLDTMGLKRNVTSSDRKFYDDWKENWQLEDALIEYACSQCYGKYDAVARANKLLAGYRSNNVSTLEQAKAMAPKHEVKNQKQTLEEIKRGEEREYTEEELRALFANLQDMGV